MSTLKKDLSQDTFLAQSSLRMLEALAGENALQRLVQIGYEMLGNPFAVIDMGFKIIAISNSSKIMDDPVWNEFVINGYTSLTSAQYYANTKFTNGFRKRLSFFLVGFILKISSDYG